MIPTPRCASSLVVPTHAPIVDWPSEARKVTGPIGVSTFRPLKAATSFGVSGAPAFRAVEGGPALGGLGRPRLLERLRHREIGDVADQRAQHRVLVAALDVA